MTKTPEGADISALQREVAAIIVRDVLQEDFDDLVEGYLDEIMQASLRIIRLPGYAAVARAFETNLAGAVIASSASASRIEELERAVKVADQVLAEIPQPRVNDGAHVIWAVGDDVPESVSVARSWLQSVQALSASTVEG